MNDQKVPAMPKKKLKIFRLILITLFFSTMLFLSLSILMTVVYKYVPVAYTPLMLVRAFENREGHDFQKKWVPLNKISRSMQQVVIRAEDSKFYEHQGFDFEAIEKAIKHNKNPKSKRMRGASTISQQTAKNVFLWPSRSWMRKGLEAYFTVLIEAIWTKDRILEVYLNVIELGNGVYGVEAGSLKFFKKHASQLGRQEAALMAAVLPNPRKMRVDRPSNYVLKRQRILGGKKRSRPIANVKKEEIAPLAEASKIEVQEDLKLDAELKRELEELKIMHESDAQDGE